MTLANPYLLGNYAPVASEETVTDLSVTGSLPTTLNGRYLRNGPNPIAPPDPATYHWFTGEGMVHGIRIEDGKARWYRNRWVRSADVAAALGEKPHPGPVVDGMDFSSNTNVIAHAGRTYAIVEAGARPYEMTYELDTVGASDFFRAPCRAATPHIPSAIRRPASCTRSPTTGPGETRCSTASSTWTGGCGRTVDIPVGGPVSIHDMSLTTALRRDLRPSGRVQSGSRGRGLRISLPVVG